MFVTLFFILSIEQDRVSSYEEQRVLVIFHEQINDKLLNKVDASVHHRFEQISAVAISINEAQIAILNNHPEIKLIEEDHIVEIENVSQSDARWGFNATKVERSWANDYKGTGIKIAVIDTGIDSTHPDLTIKDGACFVTTTQNACRNGFMDDNGHGTHVAGIIAANNTTKPFIGVAPNSTVYAIKAMDAEGRGNTSDLIKGIEWAMERKVDIINISASTDVDSTPFRFAIEKAHNQGILVVAAAGNKGKRNGLGDTVEYPAKYETVIAVAAINSQNKRSEFSATGATIEVAAPGENMYSTFPLMLDRDGNPNGYTLQSGTSMAAPFVSGILALYKQQNPMLTNEQLRGLLEKNAFPLGDIGRDAWYGFGLVQAVEGIVLEKPNVTLQVKEPGFIQLQWPAVTNATVYQIYRNETLMTETLDLSFNDWVINGNYTYQVIAVGENGKIEKSAELTTEIAEIGYEDLKNGNWYNPHLIYLSNRKIITGFSNNTIRPYENVTRAQAVTMLGRALGFKDEKMTPFFKDVDKESFASGYIQQAYEQGIVSGFPDGTFRPNQPVTRAEMAILISKAYKLEKTIDNIFIDVTEQMKSYDAIIGVASSNITKGFDDGTFRPEQLMNRLQFSVFVARAKNEQFR